MKSLALRTGLLLLVMLISITAATAQDKTASARQAALDWLNLIDQKQYRESWKQAARLFQRRVGAIIWRQKMSVGRESLGDLISRKTLSVTYTNKLPDAPDGEYFVIQYETEFSNNKSAIETVTQMLDGRQWRVAGYYIR